MLGTGGAQQNWAEHELAAFLTVVQAVVPWTTSPEAQRMPARVHVVLGMGTQHCIGFLGGMYVCEWVETCGVRVVLVALFDKAADHTCSKHIEAACKPTREPLCKQSERNAGRQVTL